MDKRQQGFSRFLEWSSVLPVSQSGAKAYAAKKRVNELMLIN